MHYVAKRGADAGKVTSTYEYVDGGYGTNSTTPLVKKVTQNGISFEYAYDSRGNLTSEKRGDLTTTYQYDALGQLIRVNDPHENATWVYNYDRGGNILSKVKYAYTTGTVGTAIETIPYVYGDSNWKDKLTSYNGQTITYDAIGNPTNDGTWTYTWQAGRQLKQMSAEGTSVSFKYDHNGLRVQKIVEQSWYPETTNYIYHGKLLTHMTVNYTDFDEVAHQDKMHFFYDAQSRPVKVEFNGTVYTYLPNLQGDIVGILDNAGTLVVEYKYDTWGKPLSTTGTLAGTLGKRNPFRYRGYVYDEESELYYLRNRYYCPVWERFINADELLYGKLLSSNVFSYCLNRPVIKIDITGRSAVAATGIGGWLASGGWAAVVGAVKAVGAFVVKAAAAGAAALGLTKITQSAASSNADERTDVQPAPGPAPTIRPSTSPAPKTTPNPNATPRIPDYPGDDPKVAPEGYQWRGRGEQGSPQGNYHNPDTGESLHPDLDHKPPVGPHWDYWGPDGVKVRIFPPN